MHAELPRFTGSVEHALDDKGRLIVPARYRERLGTGFILTIAPPEPCLALYPEPAWAEFCKRLETAPRKDLEFRRFVRHVFAHTEEVACDAQGRLLIPGPLRTYASIDREVISIGSFTRVEIWAKEQYAGHAAPEGQVADFMAELGLY
ncbi:MAG TPA: division/cell wall cluster transcriptional repressor MraZ [Candidatus Baltobacteraceae bacterium]|nr:division/cell wall cluster transcriptional repressor MraZ [Candidatus Baltobacteraceae bacterium]